MYSTLTLSEGDLLCVTVYEGRKSDLGMVKAVGTHVKPGVLKCWCEKNGYPQPNWKEDSDAS